MKKKRRRLDFDDDEGLKPAGDERRDQLKRRADRLEERGEKAFPDGGALDVSKLKPDHEILRYRGSGTEISNADPAFVYCWSRFMTGQGGVTQVERKLSEYVLLKDGTKFRAWEVVAGDMPEARELKTGPDSTRRWGDVMLLRCRKDVYAALQQDDARRREQQQTGVYSDLLEYGERNRSKGIRVHTQINNRTMRHAAAQQMATQQVDQRLRDGTVPGL